MEVEQKYFQDTIFQMIFDKIKIYFFQIDDNNIQLIGPIEISFL